MKRKTIISASSIAVFLLCSILVVSGAWAKDPVGEPGRSSGKKNPLKNVYFGEQHLHSYWSADAFATGSRQKPEDAYRWAMGETITLTTTGEKIKKSTPYDFVALTDHSEYLGVFPSFSDPKNPVSKSKAAQMFIHPDLPKKAGKAPTFAVWALKDPDSGNLDRVQIVKGWYQNGYSQEKIYDVALSDNRKTLQKGHGG
jgi:hypothetical protein